MPATREHKSAEREEISATEHLIHLTHLTELTFRPSLLSLSILLLFFFFLFFFSFFPLPLLLSILVFAERNGRPRAGQFLTLPRVPRLDRR